MTRSIIYGIETYGIQMIGLEHLDKAIENKRIDPNHLQKTLDMMNEAKLHHLIIEFDEGGLTFHNPGKMN